MSEWKEYKLGDFAVINMGQSPKSEFYNTEKIGLPFLQGNRTFGNKYPYFDTYCSEPKKVAKKGDVLFSVRAPVGDINIASEEICIGRGLASLNAKNNNNEYLYFLLHYLKTTIINNESGSVFGAVNKTVLSNIDINLPPLPEQKAIAEVLSSLDDKIDLLHRQNKTLEQMAETLFRQWFVEEAGEDWEYVALEEFVSCYNGVSYKSADLNPSETAMVTLKSFARDGEFRLDGFKEYTGKYKKTHIVKPGDLAVAHTDITQDAAIVGNPVLIIGKEEYTTLVVSMDLVKVESKKDWVSNEFIYFLMKTRLFKQHCLGYANGSTVLHLSKKAIPDFEFFLPPVEQIKLFTKQAQNLLGKKNKNIYQIRTLEKLRDTLLPKLMSGEVRVN